MIEKVRDEIRRRQEEKGTPPVSLPMNPRAFKALWSDAEVLVGVGKLRDLSLSEGFTLLGVDVFPGSEDDWAPEDNTRTVISWDPASDRQTGYVMQKIRIEEDGRFTILDEFTLKESDADTET